MNYEQLYKEALERARQVHATNVDENKKSTEYIFSVLKESEDERIRKEIIEHCKNQAKPYIDTGNECPQIQSWIDWLEKQGESKNIDSDDLETLEIWEDAIKENKEKWQLSDWFVEATSLLIKKVKRIDSNENINIKGSKVMLNACINALRAVGHSHLSDWLEKQGANSATITKGNTSVTNAEVVSHYTVIDSDSGKCTTASTTFKPKFKVGDFIVNDYCMGRVVELTNDAYLLDTEQGIPFSGEHNVHLWTIQDAKDGDIIYIKRYKDNSEWLLIFKEIKSQNTLIDVYDYYAYSITTGNVYYNYCDGLWGLLLDDEIVCPATKEQCNLLFAKMKEAGYEWNAEKKELKKIGQNPIDKFEPKFHEGDIVIKNTGFIGQILEVGDNEYILTNTGFIPFKYEHLWSRWTIEDAKDGDVLACGDKVTDCPFIFHNLTKELNPRSYCGVNTACCFQYNDENGGFWCDSDEVRPATKEQCDFLFSKMKKAGYKWDAEKKELKLLITNGGDFESENCGQKPAWSKEDERIYHSLLADIRASQNGSTNTLETYYNEQIDWLKSLKEKLKGK